MARRTRAELLAEFHRLWDPDEHFKEFQLSRLPPEEADRERKNYPDREQWLAAAQAEGVPISRLVEGARQAVNDCSEMIRIGIADNKPEGRDFLAFYRDRTGRDWWVEAGNPAEMARKILRQGRLRNETDWHLLGNLLSNVDQRVFSPEEAKRLAAMRLAFEESRPEPG